MTASRIVCVGAGQMATALVGGWVAQKLCAAGDIIACDPDAAARERFAARLPGVRVSAASRGAVAGAELIVLAVKPHQLGSVADELRGSLAPEQLVVSIAAGVRLEQLARWFGTQRLVRVMPNTPCLVGYGVSAYALGAAATAADGERVERLLGAVGLAAQVDEALLDAVTGLSGSGPAYVYLLIEALSDGGVRVGLPRALATRLAAQTVRGAAEMVLAQGEHPAVLKDRVASPGGTTIAGLQVLEERGVRAAAIAAVEAATARARELGNRESAD
ncbi:MAG: pyrroline-5-carboxylate reductase [Pirellulaceae bacterium]|jgi:pyrroline-5-carboxylate reductase|nr:pyrroline-5-carboxylate reductase [Pirellulaceae bacterium]